MVQHIIDEITEKAKKDPKKIVFPEPEDERILKACQIIAGEGIAKVIFIGSEPEIHTKMKDLGLEFEHEIRDPEHDINTEKYSEEFFNIRKSKGITKDQAYETIRNNKNYFATMMVHMGDADGMVSGSISTTADTVRPALQIIKTKEKFHKVSGLFLMILEDRVCLFADCAVIPDPSSQDLAEIAIDSTSTAKKFGIDPKVAMLSFSTNGSAKHPLVEKVAKAVKIAQEKRPDLPVVGDIQVDAALVPEICEKKFPGCPFKGAANVFIFPDLNCGNISYKLVERLGHAKAIGPILQGLNKPVNDLSRGCSIEDIVDVTAITVVEAQNDQ